MSNSLQDVIKAAQSLEKERGLPPVHLWNPPYCGDIGLVIKRDGTWLYDGSPIGRKALVKLFSSILRYDDDGKYYLVTPTEKILVTVEDAPFVATLMVSAGRAQGQILQFTNNVGDIFEAGETHPLRFAFDEETNEPAPYVTVRSNLEALMSRAVFYDLVSLGATWEVEGEDYFGVWSSGVFFPMKSAKELGF